MNYKKIYDDLIFKSISENRSRLKKDHIDYIYYELHHIVPKCMGGSNDAINLVLLTGREHFLCHWLLIRIYPKNYKLANAFWMMNSGNNKDRSFTISSRAYAEARENKTSHLKGKRNPNAKKILQSKNRNKTNQLISKKKTGNESWCKGLKNKKDFVSKKLIQIDKDNNVINVYISAIAAGKFNDINSSFLSNKARNKKEYIGYFWLYLNDITDKKILDQIINFKEIKFEAKNRKKIKCLHCSQIGIVSNINRWHNDNCKFK